MVKENNGLFQLLLVFDYGKWHTMI
jgi:hypothetical protein